MSHEVAPLRYQFRYHCRALLMSAATGIQWTDATWNPIAAFDKVTGKRGWFCTRVSEGCENCYAEQMNTWRGNGHRYRVPNLDKVELQLMEKVLTQPFSWREPRRIFVCSMTDLFLDAIPDGWIASIFAVMACARQHTFQVLTKRPERMQALLSSEDFRNLIAAFVTELAFERSDPHDRRRDDLRATAPDVTDEDWPLRNVEIGTSVETQRWADVRIPLLLRTPAAVRFLSCEPLLGPVDLTHIGRWRDEWLSSLEECVGNVERPRVDWVIVGGESGKGARPFDVQWARDIVGACQYVHVPVFVKQMGAKPYDSLLAWKMVAREFTPSPSHAHSLAAFAFKHSHGGDPAEWPEELRVRKFPATKVPG